MIENNYRVFLDISADDLKASILLAKKNLYPQSVFYFSQSLEKLGKYIILQSNVLSPDKLNTEIRHDLAKTILILGKYLINKFQGSSDPVTKTEHKSFTGQLIDKDEFINDLTREVHKLGRSKSQYQLMTDEGLIAFSRRIDSLLNDEDCNTKYSRLFDLDSQEMIKQLSALNILDQKDLEAIREIQEDSTAGARLFEFIDQKIKESNEYYKATQILTLLSIIFANRSIDSRYPNSQLSKTPGKEYSSEKTIIKLLPRFQKALEYSITTIRRFCIVA